MKFVELYFSCRDGFCCGRSRGTSRGCLEHKQDAQEVPYSNIFSEWWIDERSLGRNFVELAFERNEVFRVGRGCPLYSFGLEPPASAAGSEDVNAADAHHGLAADFLLRSR